MIARFDTLPEPWWVLLTIFWCFGLCLFAWLRRMIAEDRAMRQRLAPREGEFKLADDADTPPTIGLYRHRSVVSEEPSLFTPWRWPGEALGAIMGFAALFGLIHLPRWLQVMEPICKYMSSMFSF